MFRLKYKKLVKDAKIYDYAQSGDVGLDFGFVKENHEGKKSGEIDRYGNIVYYTGIAVEFPILYRFLSTIGIVVYGLFVPKSSQVKKSLIQSNSVGIIDFGYRGEIIVKFKPTFYVLQNIQDNKKSYLTNDVNPDYFSLNECVGQMILSLALKCKLEETNELTKTERGEMGYGEATKKRMLETN